jgi:hypothetical protein
MVRPNKIRRHLTIHRINQQEVTAKKRIASLPVRVVGEIRRYDGQKWIRTVLLSDTTSKIQLHLGGEIKLHLNMVKQSDRLKVEKELVRRPKLYSEYPIQGGSEPRANLFFHKNATRGEEAAQPGYMYGSTRMKAMSFFGFPRLRCVSEQMAELCSVEYWNIGVNAVIYRDGNDSIGFHADNDQGEEKILSKL